MQDFVDSTVLQGSLEMEECSDLSFNDANLQSPKGPYILPFWNEVPKGHAYCGLGDLNP